MILHYIRHGDPVYNPNQLTALGERQAEACPPNIKTVFSIKISPPVLPVDFCLCRYAFQKSMNIIISYF